MSEIIAVESDVDAAQVRHVALLELNDGSTMPEVIKHIREAQAAELRGQGARARGMTDAALNFLWGLTAGYPRTEGLVFDIALSMDHRRMFPELPEVDGVSIWLENGAVKFEFYDLEWHRD